MKKAPALFAERRRTAGAQDKKFTNPVYYSHFCWLRQEKPGMLWPYSRENERSKTRTAASNTNLGNCDEIKKKEIP